jgi:hypothetical protein
MTIRMIAMALVTATLLAPYPADAEAGASENDDARYSFNRVDDGYLRLDGRTGHASLCNRRSVGWTCQAIPDERAALESEIARLQGENAVLKKELVRHNLPLPGAVHPEQPVPKMGGPRLPDDADLSKIVGFMEKIWRRLVEMIVQMQREVRDKS